MPPVHETLVIPSRFCGPPASANGGVTAGLLAAWFEPPVEVTLRRPPPLDHPLTVARGDDLVMLRDGDELVAEARPLGALPIEVPSAVTVEEARAASARGPTVLHPDWHPFPTCFVCGPGRRPGDGLRIFPGPVRGREVMAAPWVPGVELAADDGRVREEFVWAALDCPSSFVMYLGRDDRPEAPYVLGRLAVRIDARPHAGQELVAMAWPLGVDGRKLFSGSALVDERGNLLAVARATWIRV
jgi:hypothetical protein